MNPSKPLPIDAIDFRADSYTPDGKNVIVSLATKYSAEPRLYALPVACLYSFITDLQKLKSPSPTQPADAPAPQTKSPPTQAAAKDSNRIEIAVPKKWMLRSGLPDHPFVLMVFDPQTEKQAGFALSAASAKEMAAGLVKYADALASHEAVKPKSD
jgi:hypothetical protein